MSTSQMSEKYESFSTTDKVKTNESHRISRAQISGSQFPLDLDSLSFSLPGSVGFDGRASVNYRLLVSARGRVRDSCQSCTPAFSCLYASGHRHAKGRTVSLVSDRVNSATGKSSRNSLAPSSLPSRLPVPEKHDEYKFWPRHAPV